MIDTQALIPILSFAGGFLLNMAVKFGHGFIDEFFKTRERQKKIKFKLADQIMDICIEGSSTGWNVRPGSQRHILRVIAEIEAVDMETAKKMKQLLSVWVLCSLPQEDRFNRRLGPTREDIETARKWQESAQNFSEELLATARNWKN